MATITKKSYEVASRHGKDFRAFVMYDYEESEAVAVLEYDGRRVSREFKAKEGIEYAAIEKAAYRVSESARKRFGEDAYGFDLMMFVLSRECNAAVSEYLYDC